MFVLVAPQEFSWLLDEVQRYIFREMLLTSAIQLVGKQKIVNSLITNTHQHTDFSSFCFSHVLPVYICHICVTFKSFEEILSTLSSKLIELTTAEAFIASIFVTSNELVSKYCHWCMLFTSWCRIELTTFI